MATKISTDPTIFFTNFNTGNDAGDFDSYQNYALDHDSNYTALRTTFNQMVDEINALGGSGALINFDLVQIGDSGTPDGVRTTGLIGEHSYDVAINGGDASLVDVSAGVAIILGNQRVESVSPVTLDGVAAGLGSGRAFIALDVNGAPSLQASAGQKSLDVASGEFNGSIFTAVSRFVSNGSQITGEAFLATIMPDGDAHRIFLDRPVVASSFIAKTYYRPADRVNALERILSGLTTDSEGHALGPLALDASWITTGQLALARGGTGKNFSGESDSDFIVGTGAGLVLESGATARTSMGVGTADTPQFAKLGLGAAASASADTLLLLSRAGDIVLEFNNSSGAQFEIQVNTDTMLATTDDTDLRLFRNGLDAVDERIACVAGGVDLFDSSGNVAVRTTTEGGTAAVQLGLSGGKVGFYATTPIALPTVSGARDDPEAALANLLTALDNLGAINDTTTAT